MLFFKNNTVFLGRICNVIQAVKLCVPLLVGVLIVASCAKDEADRKYRDGESIVANIRLSTLETTNLQTVLTSEETAIRQIQVLVFIDGIFSYKANIKNFVSGTGAISFVAYLSATTKPVDICFIANADNVILNSGIRVGDTKSAATTKIIQSLSASGITSNFPMVGIYSSSSGLSASAISAFPAVSMVRHIARVDIDATAVSNFVLSTVQAYHVNSQGQIIHSSLQTSTSVTSPSVPSAATPTISTNTLSVAAGNLSTSQLYLHEAAAPAVSDQIAKATCVVVGGYYNGSATLSYYRLDFNPNISGHPFGQILRNRLYQFTIKSVTAVGFDTPDEAANNLPVSISAQVRDWDMNTMTRYVDGSYYLTLSSRSISLVKQSGSSKTIQVSTNVPYTIQWADASGNTTGTAGTTLNDGVMSIAVTNGGATIQATALTTNTSGADIVRYVLLQGRRVSALLTIKQSIFSVSTSSIAVSASGLQGYVLVSSSSTWNFITDQTWFSPTKVTGTGGVDTLKWSALTNFSGLTRTGNLSVVNLNGDIATIPFTQGVQNSTTLNIMSWTSDLGSLGAGSAVSSASGNAQGIKYVMVNGSNYGPSGTINLAGFNFLSTTTNPITASSIGSTTNILWLATGGFDVASNDAIYTWLHGGSNRVLVFIYDLFYNASLLTKLGVTNSNVESGAAGTYPLQYTASTAYFTTTGPFTSYPYSPITSGFSYRNKDNTHGEIQLSGNSQITPILLGPNGGILLGIDKINRIVYVGDVDIFNPDAGNGATADNYLISTTGTVSNSASRLMANVWAWVVLAALGQNPG